MFAPSLQNNDLQKTNHCFTVNDGAAQHHSVLGGLLCPQNNYYLCIMCGIAGIFSSKESLRLRIMDMSNALVHRGPDAGAVWSNHHIALAHRRLSIIDVSEAAHQPMVSACGRYVIVFNGEVYNFSQLAEKLVSDFPHTFGSHGFKTHSDTEIVLELFAAYGSHSVQWLNGMFAFAIYDKNDDSVFICRDRIGIKPLFYAVNDRQLIFASELRSLMKALDVKTLNVTALPLFLHVGYVPEPFTILNEARKFPAAHYAKWNGDELSFTRYWSAADFTKPDKDVDYTEATLQCKSVLENAVSDALISDVPLGVFLSGGIDSSLVAAIAATKSGDRIKTFTVSSSDSAHDESAFARKIAKHIGSEHFELPADENTLSDLIIPILDEMDEPLADSSLLPVFIISRFARQHVTVALGGDGGDELFQGYGAYVWARRLSNPLLRLSAPLIRKYLRNRRHEQFFHPSLRKHFSSNIFSIEQNLFPSWELENLGFILPDVLKNHEIEFDKCAPEERQAMFDLHYYLKDDLLVKVDRASMLNALEVRPPLLDHRLVEWALSLPLSFKVKQGISKVMLKDILSDYIPRDLFERPKKGFSVPMQRWLRTNLSELPKQLQTQSQLRVFSVVNHSQVQQIIAEYMSGKKPYHFNRIWAIIVLSHFLEMHPDISIETE